MIPAIDPCGICVASQSLHLLNKYWAFTLAKIQDALPKFGGPAFTDF